MQSIKFSYIYISMENDYLPMIGIMKSLSARGLPKFTLALTPKASPAWKSAWALKEKFAIVMTFS